MELDAEQQAIMVAARHKGNITLTANPEGPGSGGLNVQMSEADRITLRQILGIEEPDDKKPFFTEHIRGMQRSLSQFDEDGNLLRGNTWNRPGDDPLGGGVDLQGGADWYSSSVDNPTRAGQPVSRDQVTGGRRPSL